MYVLALGMTWGLLGLDVGWRPLPSGGMEYIIQIAPHELEVFKQHGIEGDIPPQLKDIRMYRVVVGTDVLPRQDPPASSATSATKSPRSTSIGDAAINPSGPAKPAYNPFTSLSSLVSRYPFGQVASDPTKGLGSKEVPRGSNGGPDRSRESSQSRNERPLSRESPKNLKEPAHEPSKPWLPFTVAVLALFGSLGGNLYMGWITWETRARYRALLNRQKRRDLSLQEE